VLAATSKLNGNVSLLPGLCKFNAMKILGQLSKKFFIAVVSGSEKALGPL